MEKFNSSNYREPRQKSIVLLWAQSPNAKLIMSSKAPALCNVTGCVCIWRGVQENTCVDVLQKIYNEVRMRGTCAVKRWRCFIVCLCMSVYEWIHADTCICEFNFSSKTSHWKCLKMSEKTKKQKPKHCKVHEWDCNNSKWLFPLSPAHSPSPLADRKTQELIQVRPKQPINFKIDPGVNPVLLCSNGGGDFKWERFFSSWY